MAGADDDLDAALDDDEIDVRQSVCHGARSLVAVSSEGPGANCGSGGKRLDMGHDSDGNGTLEPGEVTSSSFVCNGLAQAALIELADEPPGTNCARGGKKVSTGVDANGSGQLDPGEAQVQYVCDGTPGAAGFTALVAVETEPPGASCAAGGQRVSSGLDSNGSGTLEPSERTATSYICNGPAGQSGASGAAGLATLMQIVAEAAGANCAGGGLKVTAGLDANRNGVLDTGEVSTTSFVCKDPVVVINTITASPPVVRPGETTELRVAATSAATLAYQWAGPGTFSAPTSAITNWSAPATTGASLLSVAVTDGARTATGYISVLASVSPDGPIVTQVRPAEARLGEPVFISGGGFGATQGTSTVALGGVPMQVTAWADTRIAARAPSSGATGVRVTVAGKTSNTGYLRVAWDGGVGVSVGLVDATVAPRWVPDGAGGTFFVAVFAGDVRATHLDAAGVPTWSTRATTSGTSATSIDLCVDRSAGVVVGWTNGTSAGLQRFSPLGARMWGPDGVATGASAELRASNVVCGEHDMFVFHAYAKATAPHAYWLDGFDQFGYRRLAAPAQPMDALELRAASDGKGGVFTVVPDWDLTRRAWIVGRRLADGSSGCSAPFPPSRAAGDHLAGLAIVPPHEAFVLTDNVVTSVLYDTCGRTIFPYPGAGPGAGIVADGAGGVVTHGGPGLRRYWPDGGFSTNVSVGGTGVNAALVASPLTNSVAFLTDGRDAGVLATAVSLEDWSVLWQTPIAPDGGSSLGPWLSSDGRGGVVAGWMLPDRTYMLHGITASGQQ